MTCRVFTYSTSNPYADDYYQACKKFDKIQKEITNYEQQSNDRESPVYRKMVQEFNFWDAEVPKTSNIAGQEEEKIQAQNNSKDKTRKGETLDLLG